MQTEVSTTTDAALGHDFSIWGMFMQADPLVKAVMVILVLASIWSWAIMIDKSLLLGKLKSKSSKFEDAFWSGKPLDEMYMKQRDKADHPMARVFVAAMGEWDRTKSMVKSSALVVSAQDRIEKVMNLTINRELEKAETGLSILATIGSAAVFIGLFGTVWGIMNAFQAIAQQGDTSLIAVAPGIAEALFATALGLVAAIPAVMGYNHYSSALNSYAVRLQGFADEFATILSRQFDERAK
ncbi:protein TolQ [Aquisalinus flavus]|uniref:Tol-Pal system protein TolQ n=1 Tax=Aquisalinus flavus TaxID=1526572 RepID=A0A8J2V5I8_9PROT|nr:protein TolQ [Aquisalinus flavus]MBD0426377.1 protein TolQ [Aquisalinus flavus]UNE48060.1 protein TolQ [Aquisalinus flavus]GGD08477.1 Tol-Pal system subunit TolQ [Aquisalinus flavus]